jgi:hypothetical protein
MMIKETMEQGREQNMNGNMQVSQSQSTIHTLTVRQRVFVAGLLFLGLLLSFVIVRFLDPSAALTSHLSSSEVRGAVESAMVLK